MIGPLQWYIHPATKIESETADIDIYKITKHKRNTDTPGFKLGQQWPEVDLGFIPPSWAFAPVRGPNVPPNIYMLVVPSSLLTENLHASLTVLGQPSALTTLIKDPFPGLLA